MLLPESSRANRVDGFDSREDMQSADRMMVRSFSRSETEVPVVFFLATMEPMALQSPALLSITPMIPTIGSLADALKFFKDEMGFSVLWEGGAMAGIGRDSISFNLVENDNREWANNASFSIGVSNLDALFEEYRDISAQVGALELKPWGRREFHVIIPSGVCLQFYEQQ
jgi:hypothetical protein